jgi:hypothetical protein
MGAIAARWGVGRRTLLEALGLDATLATNNRRDFEDVRKLRLLV